MKKTVQRIAAFLTGMFVLHSGAGAAGYETYLENGEIPLLQKYYENRMDIGVSADGIASMETTATDRILLQCGLLMHPAAVRSADLPEGIPRQGTAGPGKQRKKERSGASPDENRESGRCTEICS